MLWHVLKEALCVVACVEGRLRIVILECLLVYEEWVRKSLNN